MADVPQYTTVARPKDYWMSPRALSITLNARSEANRIAASASSGAQFFCHFEDIGDAQAEEMFGYDVGHNFRSWPLAISPTYFNTNNAIYPHIAIPRTDRGDSLAMVVFPTVVLDLWGYETETEPMQDEDGNYIDEYGNIVETAAEAATGYVRKKKSGTDTDADPVGSEEYYYIYLHGKLLAPFYRSGSLVRDWDHEIDTGRLNTDETWGEAVTLEQLAREMKKKVDVEWFQRVFKIHGTDGKRVPKDYDDDGKPIEWETDNDGNYIYEGQKYDPQTGKLLRRDIKPNDMDHEITDTESMFGTWTQHWLSALGIGSGSGGSGGGGGGDALEWPLLDINAAGMPTNPSAGDTIVYDPSVAGHFKWGQSGLSQQEADARYLKLTAPVAEVPQRIVSKIEMTGTFDLLGNFTLTTGTMTLGSGGSNNAELNVTGDITLERPDGWSINNNSVLTKADADSMYVSVAFFESLFELHSGASGNPKINTNTDLSTYTAQQKALFNIKAMFGTWTEQYLSALGIGSGGSGGAALSQPLLSINQMERNPSELGQTLVWGANGWDFGMAGLDADGVRSIGDARYLRLTSQSAQTVRSSINLTGTLSVTGDITLSRSTQLGQTSVLTKGDADSMYVTVAFWNSLFETYNGTTKVNVNTENPTINNLKILVGTWTEQYLSALGTGSGGGAATGIDWEALTHYDGDPSHVIASGYLDIEMPEPYVLPKATDTVLGGIKVGDGLTMANDGTLSLDDITADDISDLSLTDGVITIGEDSITPLTDEKLKQDYKWWGASMGVYNNVADVRGDMSNVGNIAFDRSGRNIGGVARFDTTNKRLGINTGSTDPAYTLDVNGTIRVGSTSYANLLGISGSYLELGSYGNEIVISSGSTTTMEVNGRSSGSGIGKTIPTSWYWHAGPQQNSQDTWANFVLGKLWAKTEIQIGSIRIVNENGGLHVIGGGLYADTYVSALGTGSGGGAATGIDWEALTTYDNDSTHRIAKEYLSNVTKNLVIKVNGTEKARYNGTEATTVDIKTGETLSALTINGGSGTNPAVTYNPTDEQAKTLTVSGETNVLTVTAASGSLTLALATAYGDAKNPYGKKNPNTVLAGPSSGTSTAVPAFRALVAADIPDLDWAKITTGKPTSWWGQNSWTDGAVKGDMSSVGNIAFQTSGKNIGSLAYFFTTSGSEQLRVSSSSQSAAYTYGSSGSTKTARLHVDGNISATGEVYLQGIDFAGYSNSDTSKNHGGYLDFNYGAQTSYDYTTRIIESGNGVLSIIKRSGATGLIIGGNSSATKADYIKIGGATITWDNTNQALHIDKGVYSDTYVSALGIGSGGGSGGGGMTEDQMWVALGTDGQAKQITLTHLTLALQNYAKTDDVTKTLTFKDSSGTVIETYDGKSAKEVTLSSGDSDSFCQIYRHELAAGKVLKITFGNRYHAMVYGRGQSSAGANIILTGVGYTTASNYWRCIMKGSLVSWRTQPSARGIEVSNGSSGILYISVVAIRGAVAFEVADALSGEAVTDEVAMTSDIVKNTAGVYTSSDAKLYLIGSKSTSSDENGYAKTFTNTGCYISSDGDIYSNLKKVITASGESSQFLKGDGSLDSSNYKATTINDTTAGSEGYERLTIGNSTKLSAAKSKYGIVRIYQRRDTENPSKDVYYGQFVVSSALTNNRTYTLPNKAGTVAMTSDIPSTDNFVDTSSDQSSIGGKKTFTSNMSVNANLSCSSNITSTTDIVSTYLTVGQGTQNTSYNLYVSGTGYFTGHLYGDGKRVLTTNTGVTLTSDQTISGSKIFSVGLMSKSLCIETKIDGTADNDRAGEINRYGSDLHLQYHNQTGYTAGGVTMCYNGGCVAIGYSSQDTDYKLKVNGTSFLNGRSIINGISSVPDSVKTKYNNAKLCVNGNTFVYGTAHAQAFDNISDMRLKTVTSYIDDLTLTVEDIARAPIFNFTWNYFEDKREHVGTSAQYWLTKLPNVVDGRGAEALSMDYSATALAAAVMTARKVMDHEEQIAAIMRRLSDVEAENKAIRQENLLLRQEVELLKAA